MIDTRFDPLPQGSQYRGFAVDRSRPIPELRCQLIELHHRPSGAQVIHIAADDPENLFCLSFQTLPYSSNGVAHVLEHLVLCGSHTFPVRDPFFSMGRRSLNTFMNALTGTDCTCYPASSQIEKDFYNLLDVYLDAVFHPILDPLSFLQEAHRLEYAAKNDPSSPLLINGVVYNEMKGALTRPMRRLMKEMYSKLFPETPYGHDSGGIPQEIPFLTLEELRAFHATYYHPGRCIYFFYGDLPLKKHLDVLEDRILGRAEPSPQSPTVPRQRRSSHPTLSQISYPITETESQEHKAYVGFGWLTTDIQNQLDCLALCVLDIILFDTDASFLKFKLLQTGLCRQVSSFCDMEIAEVPFMVVASGCNAGDAAALQATIVNGLQELITSGIPNESIDDALHQLELAKSEIVSNGTPFGLSLYSRAIPLAHHGLDPIVGLEIHRLFQELRDALEEDQLFFQKLIHQYLLNNRHFVRVVMTPSPTLSMEEREEEQRLIHQIQNQLGQEGIQNILKQTEALTAFHEQEQDLSCLPTIHLSDVPRQNRTIALDSDTSAPIEVFSHEACTNGLVYLDVVTPIPLVRQEDLWLVRLYAHLIPQLGCGSRNYQETLRFLQAHTGGLHASLSLNTQVSNPKSMVPCWHLRGKSLDRNISPLCRILNDVLLAPRLDERERIREVLEKLCTELESGINHHALDYALCQASAPLSEPLTVAEEWYGLSYVRKIKDLVTHYTDRERSFLEHLKATQQSLMLNNGIQIVACSDGRSLTTLKENSFFGLRELPTHPFHPWAPANIVPPRAKDKGFVISSHVSFSAVSVPTVPYAHRDSPLLSVLAQLMNDTSLHHALREQGGAYGGGASSNPTGATFSLYSYKDPNMFITLKAYEDAVGAIQNGEFSEQELEEAKLGTLQDLDAPISPGSRAEVAYGRWRQGKSEQHRQRFRDRLMSATKEDILALIPKYFPPHWSEHRCILFAGKDLFDKERPLFESQNRPLETCPCI